MEPTEPTPPPSTPPLAPPTTPQGDYWSESRRPWVSLLFLTPLLVLYEGGVLWETSAAARNGADLWLRTILDAIGFGHYFLLPLLLVTGLLGWHYTTGEPWRIAPATLFGMAVECSVLAVCLWGTLQWQALLWQIPVAPIPSPLGQIPALEPLSPCPPWLIRMISYLGAGLYEELLFRLILLPLGIGVLRLSGLSTTGSFLAATLATSGLFALAHYLGPAGEAWNPYTFSFRFLAGVFFCGLFWIRGFGIAAGTHAGYDILVGILMS